METVIGAGGVGGGGGGGGIPPLNDDILRNIIGRLPARSFASAACVCKTWNSVCNRILCRPKFSSAVSLNPSLHVAVEEVLQKVLSEPIRPHFAIACIGVEFNLEAVHHLITKELGSRTPVITNAARGIMGLDALTNEVKEVKWESVADYDLETQEYNSIFNRNRGIVLAVGFLPGFKIDEISLPRSNKVFQGAMVDKFIMDIKDFTASVSDSTSPSCIILFGDHLVDIKPILAKLDSAMDEETVIVGDACGFFLSRSRRTINSIEGVSLDTVALVLASDKIKPQGLGETSFHFTSSTGTIPFGPELRAASTKVRGSRFTWLSALMEGDDEILYGHSILKALKEEIKYDDLETDLFIGVRQNREHTIGSQNLGPSTSLAMYKVLGGDKEYFVVDGVGIRPGDSFLFYHSDSQTAASSSYIALEHLATLKPLPITRATANSNTAPQMNQVFGGLIFSCHCRGPAYFGRPNVNTSPFTENFPGVPFAGVFCAKEIGRAFTRSIRMEEKEEEEYDEDDDDDDDDDDNDDDDNDNDDDYDDNDDNEDEDSIHRYLHVYSTVYLVMSHTDGVVK
ncbi:F-box/LRR-repeat protein At5g63520-like [Cucurbita maxima]|uniref:F-box/LRR-repeat protein At5g63520-like n=1 Tax=Cucurbita maxima TaxID=3661 RepID=A0A6J1JVL6_CUCMA|nr:F-box/LRR-repeat protein At5g63520-like [Cucurbita maxima]